MTGLFTDQLAELRAAALHRTLRAPTGIDLSSNDYLGLAEHPAVRDALRAALDAGAPTGASGSRLLSGQHPAWTALEARFAAWQGAEAALFFATGFAANSGVLAALAGPGDLLVCDALLHASLIDGARASRAERVIVPHLDLDAVDAALRAPARRKFVVTESVFSMDGDLPDLPALAALCARHGAHLIVDEAHATGLYGPSGEGLIAAQGLRDQVLLSIHPCGKALGQAGAFVCGPADVIDWLVQRARPFVFSTAPAPFLAAGLHAALDVVQADPALRARPAALAERLRSHLRGQLDTGRSAGHIVPVLFGPADVALTAEAALTDRGWHARAIRPPTVPTGASRLRLVLRAALTEADVDRLGGDLLDLLR